MLYSVRRDSNMELLRIVAMFLVLTVHAAFYALGTPTTQECRLQPMMAYGQFFWGSVSMTCVNTFVLLSGWFGIRPKLRSFSSFIFQCLFFSLGIYILWVCLGMTRLSWRGITDCLFVHENYWFIVSYIGLYLFSPMVNAFVDNSKKTDVLSFLIFFFIFQIIFSYCSKAAPFLSTGCNSMSFIGLYVLARYIRLYPSRLTTLSAWTYFSIFLLMALFSSISAYTCAYMGYEFLIGRFYTYVSPFVIVPALLLLLLFSRMSFSNNVVNWFAISSFSVYLIHMHPCLIQYYVKMVNVINDNTSGVFTLLFIFLFLFGVFVVSVLLDKIRLLVWNLISVRKAKE